MKWLDYRSYKPQWKRVCQALLAPETNDTLNQISKCNSDLIELLGHRRTMAALGRSRTRRNAIRCRDVRESVKSLYRIISSSMATKCHCTAPHIVHLDTDIPESQLITHHGQKTNVLSISFNMVFSVSDTVAEPTVLSRNSRHTKVQSLHLPVIEEYPDLSNLSLGFKYSLILSSLAMIIIANVGIEEVTRHLRKLRKESLLQSHQANLAPPASYRTLLE